MQMQGLEDIWSAINQGSTALINTANAYQQYKLQEAQAKALRGAVAANPMAPLPMLLPGGQGYVPTVQTSIWSGNAPMIALGIGAAVLWGLTTLVMRGTDDAELDATLAAVSRMIVELGGEPLDVQAG